MLGHELAEMINQLRTVGAESSSIEAKTGVGRAVLETLSAFSNHGGGILIVGVSENDGFTVVQDFNPKAARDALTNFCDQLSPPARPEISIVPFESGQVLVAEIPEMEPQDKPCYVTERGLYKGSYIRTGDSERRLTPYEVDRIVENKGQPSWDREPVPDASLEDLDVATLSHYTEKQQAAREKTFADGMPTALRRLQVLRDDNPTLASLLTMGDYPQQFYPRLAVTFALYPGTGKGDITEGFRLLDSARITGPIPEMVEEGVRLVEKNMRTAGLIEGVFRKDVPDYPPVAIREALVNALMHRDYSPTALGTPVQIDMYVDRLQISNPGGLFGGVTAENLGQPGVSTSRNQLLSTFLEDLSFSSGGTVAENRGTGIAVMRSATASALMPPPEFSNTLTHFTVTFHKRKVASTETHETAYEKVSRLLQERTSWSTTELKEATGLSRTAVQKSLNQLLTEGVAEVTEPLRSPRQRYRRTR
ncbi:DNA-binding protein [Corynebacterium mucifaciens]|uniref:DNA-binding protein n=3 Tax=Corynebacterium mucifaciens TaxID=57171 RepID=A0A7X6LQT6_9CORY|nr:DNA-binding protein [Corynebacterium mucifaciens]